MPELPEVENIRRSLLPFIVQKQIDEVLLLQPSVFLFRSPGLHLNVLHKTKIHGLERRGKYLIWELHRSDSRLIMLSHLRMTGRLLFHPYQKGQSPAPLGAHTHIVFYLEEEQGGRSALHFQDPRRFGRFELFTAADFQNWKQGIATLGPEPFAPEMTAPYLMAQAQRHARLSLAGFLLRQEIIAGLGNIYVQELLFRMRLHPAKSPADVSQDLWCQPISKMQEILLQSIQSGGTTFRDYVDANGKRGDYSTQLDVYGRANLPCHVCARPLITWKASGRSIVFCPHCQC